MDYNNDMIYRRQKHSPEEKTSYRAMNHSSTILPYRIVSTWGPRLECSQATVESLYHLLDSISASVYTCKSMWGFLYVLLQRFGGDLSKVEMH